MLWLGAFLVAMLVSSWVWAYRCLNGISSSFLFPEGGVEGSLVQGEWQISNSGPTYRVLLRMEGTFPFLGTSLAVFASYLPANKLLRYPIQGMCKKRGIYNEIPLQIVGKDPLGFFVTRKWLQYSGQFTVYPRIVHLQHFPIVQAGRIFEPVGVLRTLEGAGQEFFGIRPFFPGDSLRRVHWLTTGRKHSLHLKQFFPETTGHFLIILDTESSHHFGNQNDDTFEISIRLSASLCFHALQSGLMGTVALGPSMPIYPVGSGESHLHTLLSQMAALRQDSQPFLPFLSHSLSLLAPFSSFVIVITPFLSPAFISILGEFREKIPQWLALFVSPYEHAKPEDSHRLPSLPDVQNSHQLALQFHIPVYTIYREEEIAYLD